MVKSHRVVVRTVDTATSIVFYGTWFQDEDSLEATISLVSYAAKGNLDYITMDLDFVSDNNSRKSHLDCNKKEIYIPKAILEKSVIYIEERTESEQ